MTAPRPARRSGPLAPPEQREVAFRARLSWRSSGSGWKSRTPRPLSARRMYWNLHVDRVQIWRISPRERFPETARSDDVVLDRSGKERLPGSTWESQTESSSTTHPRHQGRGADGHFRDVISRSSDLRRHRSRWTIARGGFRTNARRLRVRSVAPVRHGMVLSTRDASLPALPLASSNPTCHGSLGSRGPRPLAAGGTPS